MSRVAIVDDDRKLLDLLKEYLEKNGYKVKDFINPETFLKRNYDIFDIVILDIVMPQIDGFELLREIRKKSNIPVLMLTARGDVYDRIVGLELGADDYLPKPFEPRELLARIEAILRRLRPEKLSNTVFEYNSFKFYPDSMRLVVGGKDTTLTTAEYQLLLYFCTNPFRVLTRDMIMENTKEIQWESFDRSVDVLVSRLRKKLGDNPSNPSIIKTIWGEGYMFIAKKSKTGIEKDNENNQ